MLESIIGDLKMKIVVIIFVILSSVSHASVPAKEFKKRHLQVLQIRKEKIISNISTKLEIKESEVEKNLQFVLQDDILKIQGFLKGSKGVCRMKGTISLLETSVVGNCIDDSYKITIIWP